MLALQNPCQTHHPPSQQLLHALLGLQGLLKVQGQLRWMQVHCRCLRQALAWRLLCLLAVKPEVNQLLGCQRAKNLQQAGRHPLVGAEPLAPCAGAENGVQDTPASRRKRRP